MISVTYLLPYILETMDPGALFTVRPHPLPSMNVLMFVSSFMTLLSQGHTTVKGQNTVSYCSLESVLINILLHKYIIYKNDKQYDI